MFDNKTISLINEVVDLCKSSGLKVTTAESCTGGLIATALTHISGSSAVFEGSFVTYSNAAKQQMLGVPQQLLDQYGAVSEQVARMMAEGALKNTNADIAVSVTGIAGPDGGSIEKPVGLVHFGCAGRFFATQHQKMQFDATDRQQIRHASLITALSFIRQIIRSGAGGSSVA